jgi:hypothetical protein
MIFLSGFAGLWFYQKRIISNSAKKTESYPEYLNSKKWDDLKKIALERADYQCELCDAPYNHIHHVKYPKRHKEDHVDNLVVVCQKCHALLHGIRDIKITEESKILYSEDIKAKHHKYSFRVISSVNGAKCLHITGSQIKGDDRQIKIMGNNIERFMKNMKAGFNSLRNDDLFREKMLENDLTYDFEVVFNKENTKKFFRVTESVKNEYNQIIIFKDEELDSFSDSLNKAVNSSHEGVRNFS